MKKLTPLIIGVVACLVCIAASYNTPQSFVNGTSTSFKYLTSLGTPLAISYNSTTADVADYTNELGQLITQGTNSIGTTYGAWSREVNGWAASDGSAGFGTIYITILGRAANNTTNGITFSFVRSGDGSGYDLLPNSSGTGSSGPFTFSITNVTPTIDSTFSTNVPSWFMQGLAKSRLQTITFATNSFATTNVLKIKLGGFVP